MRKPGNVTDFNMTFDNIYSESSKETGKREEIETIPLSLKIKQGIGRN